MTSLTQRLRELGLELPALTPTYGAYVPARRAGNLIYVAGQLPRKAGALMAAGPVPSACSPEQARAAARFCVINGIAAAASAAPSVDSIVGVVRVGAFVASDNGFTDQPKVADGASEMLLEIFGERGRHARAAVGVNVLPAGASLEIEFIFELAEK